MLRIGNTQMTYDRGKAESCESASGVYYEQSMRDLKK